VKPLTNFVLLLLVGFSAISTSLSGAAITSGTISLPSFQGNGTFTLLGSDFTVSGGLDAPAFSGWLVVDACRPCSSGFALPVAGQAAGSSFHGGSGQIGGTAYSALAWGDGLAAHGSSFIITGPQLTLNGPGTYTGSFSFTGFLCGTTAVDSGPHACTADLQALTGSGQVSVNVVQDVGSLLRSESATYTFTSVPEPSTFILAVPLIVLLGHKKRGFA
jgi:hypothetical protein